MAKIEVGMLVEICGIPPTCFGEKLNGYRGVVLSYYEDDCWWVDGATINPETGRLITIRQEHLRPITPPKSNQDIEETRELGSGLSFESLMETLKVKEEA